MTSQSRIDPRRRDPLHVVACDPGWPSAFEQQRQPGDEPSRKLSFCFPDIAWRTHHLHIFEATAQNGPLLPHRLSHSGDQPNRG